MRRIFVRSILASSLAVASAAHAQSGTGNTQAPRADRTVQLGRTDVRFGAGLSVFRVGALRDPSLPARTRHYDADIRTISSNLIFQVSIRPAGMPWRRTDESTLRSFQILSLAPFLLLDIREPIAQSELALGFGIGLLEDALVLGLGLSLYRGVPVRGGDGARGGQTTPTGVLAALLASDGEVTVENLFFTVNLNVVAIGRSLMGGSASP